MGTPLEPLYYYNFALLILVALVAYLLRRLLRDFDELRKKTDKLECDVCILIDRDRRKRLQDYGAGEWAESADS